MRVLVLVLLAGSAHALAPPALEPADFPPATPRPALALPTLPPWEGPLPPAPANKMLASTPTLGATG